MLDPYVWKEAAAFLAERLQEHKTVCPLSVNISRADMALKNLPSIIHHILAEYSIPSSLFKLEITESAFDNNNEALFLTIDKLHQMGHLILMDDFGSGYSNLNTFKKMPVDILKADMGFMSDLDASEKGRIIVRNVVNITKELHMPIIVEGVETQIQYDYLKELHCEQIQGYYFSKPLPADEFARLLDMQETAIT